MAVQAGLAKLLGVAGETNVQVRKSTSHILCELQKHTNNTRSFKCRFYGYPIQSND